MCFFPENDRIVEFQNFRGERNSLVGKADAISNLQLQQNISELCLFFGSIKQYKLVPSPSFFKLCITTFAEQQIDVP